MYASSITIKPPTNNIYIASVIVLSSILWITFKLIYPYPFITIDSYYYINAAYQNAYAGSWPIGYSKFIQLIGFISHSPTLLVTCQYIILQSSFLAFFFTVRNHFNLTNRSSLILFIFLFLNPLFIIGSNHIMSDILFTGLSLLWVTHLLWILKSPKPYMIITQAMLILTIFTIRYTALFFPLFTIIVFIVSPQSPWRKTAGIALTILLLGIFIQFTRIKMEEIGGIRQFSSAGGWKQASNALYMYGAISNDDSSSVPERFKTIHQLTKSYFKGPHTNVDLYNIDQEFTTGSFYVAAHESPLMQYLRIKKGENADIFDFKNIAPFGPYFNAYGNYLILNHPVSYFKFVVLPDITAYLYPFPEIYGSPEDLYYLWPNYMGDVAKRWFGLTTVSIPVQFIQIRGIILKPAPLLFSIIHITFLLSLVVAIILKLYSALDKSRLYAITLITAICIGNFLFTILSAASVLRFQFSFTILEFTIALLLFKWLWDSESKNPTA